jgi:hypothetical protein
LIKLFKVCGFSRQSLESRSAEQRKRLPLATQQATLAHSLRFKRAAPSVSAWKERKSVGFLILSALSRVARMVVACGEWLSASRNGYLPTAK